MAKLERVVFHCTDTPERWKVTSAEISGWHTIRSAKLSHWHHLVNIMLLALLVVSCNTTKQIAKSQSKEVSDSLVIKETREAIPVIVPKSKAQLTIPMKNLRKLPLGATYTKKSGQATVEAKYVPDNSNTGEPEYIIVTSTCDSLQVLCWKQEKELIRIRNDTEKEKTEIKEDTAKQKNRCLWAGFICGICVTMVIRFLINKIKRFF